MKKKSINGTQSNSGAFPKLNRKFSSKSFSESESTESTVQSKLRRSTRRATIERRVWCPPQKEKFCHKIKYNNKGRPSGSKSAYVKWKEAQKRKMTCRQNFLKKSRISLHQSKHLSIANGNFSNLSNGSYLLENLDREGVIGDNEKVSLQSVITDEVITDPYADRIHSKVDGSHFELESEINLPCTSKSSTVITIDKISESNNKQKFLDSEFENLSLTASDNVCDQDINSPQPSEELNLEAERSSAAFNDDTHVSLDEALAELVDLQHGNDCETVTIHPAFSDNYEKTNIETLPLAEEELTPLNLIVAKSNETKIHFAEVQGNKLSSELSDEKLLDIKLDSHNTMDSGSDEIEESPSYEKMNKLPNLIGVPSKPLSIRTPLKCSACSMRFCTVRSLLWHFGTHMKLRPQQESPAILENILASWDAPEKKINMSNSKIYNYNTDSNGSWRPFSYLNGEISKSESYFDNDSPEDLSVSKRIKDNFVGANGEVILKVPSIRKPKIVPKSSSLRDLLTSVKVKNKSNDDSFRSSKSSRKRFSFDGTNSERHSSANGKQIPNFTPTTSVYAVTQLTPTISCSHATLETCPTDANIRLLSHVSNTLNKMDTSNNREKSCGSTREIIPSNVRMNKENCSIDDESMDEENLVRINDSLALRIVSTATTVGELTISVTNSNNLCQKSNQFTNTVSIFPQTKMSSEISPIVQTPDILTIVPQTEVTQIPNCDRSSPPHIITATGKLNPDSSGIVKLVLMPHEMDTSKRDFYSSDDSSEESDCGMVIDVKDEDNGMDPLSLCSVSLDEEIVQVRETSASSDDLRIACNERKEKKTNCRLNPKVDEEIYNKRKYVCDYCQKRFGWSTDLKRHIILHTGERPFKCKWCPVTFTRKFLLQNHMRKMHSELCKWSDLWE